MTPAPRSPAGRRGRPVDPDLADSIMSAAAEILTEGGVAALTVRAVVARSGSSSATLYRRWPTKASLLLAVTKHLMSVAIPVPRSGDFARDIEQVVRNLVFALTASPIGAALPHILEAAHSSPEVAREVSEWLAGRRLVVRRILRGALAAGDVRASLPIAYGAELLSSPIYYRFAVTREPLDESFVETHVDEFLRWARR